MIRPRDRGDGESNGFRSSIQLGVLITQDRDDELQDVSSLSVYSEVLYSIQRSGR